MPRKYEVQLAMTHKKQTAYGTTNADGDLTIGAMFSSEKPLTPKPDLIRDNSQLGQGDEWPRTQEIERWQLEGSLEFDLTSRMAGHFLAFGLGAISTSQPNAGPDPTVYDHDITPQSAATSIQLPQMTLLQRTSAGIKKKIRDLVVDTLTISGKGHDRLKISVGLVGSGFSADSVVAMPAIAAAKFLRMKDLKLEIGAFGGGLTDFSSRVKSWEFKINNNHLKDDGFFPGSGLYRGRCEFDKRDYMLSFVVLVDAASQEQDRLLANTNLAAKMTAEGENISGIYNHRLIVETTDVHYEAVELGYEDNKLAYQITCNINYDEAGGVLRPLKASVRNNVAAYLN
jgi:hypothetical protein